MLQAATTLHQTGVDVLVGVIEHDGRGTANPGPESGQSLPRLPLLGGAADGAQDGTNQTGAGELDLAAALARKPALILIDELAHANPAGQAHPMRWQDVAALLAAGIDVFTTAQVQDLQSLNDVVASITGVRCAVTIPDAVFDAADEIVLVDLSLDEWQARLQRRGGGTADLLRRGNLIALRELALRRTAERRGPPPHAGASGPDGSHRAGGAASGSGAPPLQPLQPLQSAMAFFRPGAATRFGASPANPPLLACVGPYPDATQVILRAARLATQLNTDWHAIYIETPALQQLPHQQHERILTTLKQAELQGATTAVLRHSDITGSIVDYAHSRHCGKIVLGRGHRHWLDHVPWGRSRLKQIAARMPEIDLIEVGRSEARATGPARLLLLAHPARWRRFLFGAGASVATALLALPLLPYLELSNIAMLFLLTVVLVAQHYGRKASVLATVIGVLALAIPYFPFNLGDLRLVLTFGLMLAVGLITGKLTADLRYQLSVAAQREARSQALYEFARALSGALQTGQIYEITRSFVEYTFHARATLLLPDAEARLQSPEPISGDAARLPDLTQLDLALAQQAFDLAEPAGIGTRRVPESNWFYQPLVAPMRTRGVLAIAPQTRHWALIPEQRQQLDTFAALAAIALERVHYIEVAQGALIHMESERLRNSLLSALSHDLRTPLTSLVGLSESLALSSPPLSGTQRELAESLRDEALRMSNMVANLLDMARISDGKIKLNLQWQYLEEVVGSSLRASHSRLRLHQLETRLAADLPLVRFDAVAMERVLCNLLENAAKYTPPGSRIILSGRVAGQWLEVAVCDNGPGVPVGLEQVIFEKFTRGERESNKPGVGLGLSICRALVEAHGGSIRVEPATPQGAIFCFTLPLGTPPELPELDEPDSFLMDA
jgi:two-component system sensor histidine kinase KdpD